MNIIIVPILPLLSKREKSELEVTSNKLKSGATDPREIMFEGVLAIIIY